MKSASLLLFATAICFCNAQSINCGGPATGTYLADQFFAGGVSWSPVNQPSMGTQTGVYQTLRFSAQPGQPFTYTFPVTAGVTAVSVLLMEPSKTGPGQRIFTVTINGWVSAPIDLYALTGGIFLPYEVDSPLFVASNHVTVTFTPLPQSSLAPSNAVCSAITVLPAPMAPNVGGIGTTPGTGTVVDCLTQTTCTALPDGAYVSYKTLPPAGPGVAQHGGGAFTVDENGYLYASSAPWWDVANARPYPPGVGQAIWMRSATPLVATWTPDRPTGQPTLLPTSPTLTPTLLTPVLP